MTQLPKLPQLNKIYQADCLEFMKGLPDNCIDLVVTDPPYGYSFMGKDWDTFNEIVEPKGAYQKQKGFTKLPRNKPNCMYENFVPVWKECLRILKPGAFMFVMSAPRQDTLFEQIRAIKDAGFRTDFTSIYWTYASGFPKAYNIAKGVEGKLKLGTANWSKWGELDGEELKGKLGYTKTQHEQGYRPKDYTEKKRIGKCNYTTDQAKVLDGSYGGFQPKPAVEVILVAMKPLSEKTYVDQVMKNRKGVTWLDDCRMPYQNKQEMSANWSGYRGGYGIKKINKNYRGGTNIQGRFPANLLVSDDVLNDGKIRKSGGVGGRVKHDRGNGYGFKPQGANSPDIPKDSGSFSRYFDLDKWAVAQEIKNTFPFLVIPKASKREKNKGCEKLAAKQLHDRGCHKSSIIERPPEYKVKNNHPTVKPLKLMSYLITLGSRKGDIILDPFSGSGTTCIAAQQLGRKFIGIEKEEAYCEIAKCRLGL